MSRFFPRLFGFFVVVNWTCYAWALATAFPEQLNAHYFRLSFPVAILGAVFDSLSFFVTIVIIRRALKARSVWTYVGHLCIDLVIAALATLWVLFVFSVSGWLISLIEAKPQTLTFRRERYGQFAAEALENPQGSLRNIYFGAVMGISAALPTALHLFLFLRALLSASRRSAV